MNMKLYGICFKLRGGPNLLDHVQENKPVPVEMMGQVMDQIGSLTKEEIDFAELLDKDWKKAFGERVPLTMTVAADKGYDITCSVPDELIETVSLITGKTPVELMKEYASDHMKNVLGIDADILSVDAEHEDTARVQTQAQEQTQAAVQSGFSMSDLDEEPVIPAFDNVADFAEMNMGMDIPVEGFGLSEGTEAETVKTEASKEEETEGISADDLMSALEEDPPVKEESFGDGEQEYGESEIPLEGPDEDQEFYEEPDIPDDEEAGDEEGEEAGEQAGEDEKAEEAGDEEGEEAGEQAGEDEKAEEAGEDEKAEDVMANAVAGIYKDMVKNIKDRQLDERLGLRIGQTQ